MTSEERTQKFRNDDVSLPGSGECIWLVEEQFPSLRDQSEELAQILVVTRHQYEISAVV